MYRANNLVLTAFDRQHVEAGLLHLQEFILKDSQNYRKPGANDVDLWW
jgi:hypothetical protein